MKIKVSFNKIVDADSIEEAYSKIIEELKQGTKSYGLGLGGAYDDCFTFKELGEHTGYGEGSVDYDY